MATLLRDEVTNPTARLEESVDIVLSLLSEYNTRATFFVVGTIAEKYPNLMERIVGDGHEIGSHGHTHTPIFELNKAEFAEELTRSSDAITSAVGQRPLGFRAPNFSITRKTSWALNVLTSQGFRYDSSVFPVRTPMYGVTNAPVEPYVPGEDSFSKTAGRGAHELVEFPLAVFHPTFRVPIAGGFYARLLPSKLLRKGIKTLNRRGIPATLYFHPWEFNPRVVRTDISLHKQFVSFHGVSSLRDTVARILESFEFGPLRELLPAYA
ncbi:polysaccharide deacetylase family protein [Haloarcula limicola]|nr:polysaccharide deacetylase family protein [Halomicroarcula limicola]